MFGLIRKTSISKICIFLVLLMALLAGSAATWFYFGTDVPQKIPVRAKQVFLLF